MGAEIKKKRNFKSWLDGDMLLSPLLQRHLGLILLVFALIIAYVSNRYANTLQKPLFFNIFCPP